MCDWHNSVCIICVVVCYSIITCICGGGGRSGVSGCGGEGWRRDCVGERDRERVRLTCREKEILIFANPIHIINP